MRAAPDVNTFRCGAASEARWDQKHGVLILSVCIEHAWCPVLRAERSSMPRLVNWEDTPPFSSEWPETGTHLRRVVTFR